MRKVHPCIFHRAFAWKSIREHGGRVPLSTDFPVVSLDPFNQNIKTLITVCDGKIVYLSPEFNISAIPSSRISSIPLHIQRSTTDKLLCRTAKQSEFKFIVTNLAKQGLGNPGLYDHEIMPTVDKNGWFVGELNGKIVSSISCVKWNKQFGYIGHYVCDIRHRGNGYGVQTWNHGLNYLQDCETIALDTELSSKQCCLLKDRSECCS